MFSYHFMLILHLCVPHHISECIEICKREARQKSHLIQSLKYILLVASASNSMTRLSRHCCTPEGYFKIFFCSCSSCISPSEVCLRCRLILQHSMQAHEIFLCELTISETARFASRANLLSARFCAHA